MIKFFKRIRQSLLAENRFTRYVIYAIGEIALVMIGILLALQVNNWNEERKANNQQRVILKNLLQDLEADSISFSSNLQTLKDLNSLHKTLYDVGVAGKSGLTIDKPHYIRRGLNFNPITGDNDPFIANKISSETIRDQILVYLRRIKSMQGVRGNLGEVVRSCRQYLSQNNAHAISGWFESPSPTRMDEIRYDLVIKPQTLIELSKNPEFQQLLMELSIKTTESMLVLESVIDQNGTLMQTIDMELGNN